MIELKSTFNSNFEIAAIALQNNFETNNFLKS